MKTRCPNCGAVMSLDVLMAHDDAREALTLVFKLSGALGAAVTRYIGLFRPARCELSMNRVAKLLREIVPDIQRGEIERNGAMHPAPPEAWIAAIAQALVAREHGRLKLPLTGHGWLYEVIASQRPASAVTAAPVAAPAQSARPSKTLGAIAALEERARD
ncbi:hypothetical protein [Thauera sp.]|uniref:hypothetical protein n=1 Tax=Thauera sp. TaxID=1905334 RepID=UPI0039E2B61E